MHVACLIQSAEYTVGYLIPNSRLSDAVEDINNLPRHGMHKSTIVAEGYMYIPKVNKTLP